MGGKIFRAISMTALVAIASCGTAQTTEPTVSPQPATEAEMEAFCEAYESVRNQSWGELTAALIEVSPAEIQDEMIRTSEPPGESWEEDRVAVEAFLDRCDQPS
jgi:hypothetical protein